MSESTAVVDSREDASASHLLEPGQTVRWRSRRWRVTAHLEGGYVELVGVDDVNRDRRVSPLLELEADAIEPDEIVIPELDVASSERARWRAMHYAYLATMAGGREQLRGLDWGAIAVEPYQAVPLMRVAKSIRTRLLIADDTGLGKTAEAGLILRWLAQRHQAKRVLIVTRASPDPERWRDEMWTKFGFRFDILQNGQDFNRRRLATPTVNVFAQQPHLIVSMTLAARQALLDELRRCPAPFDVVIVDEGHHLAERGSRTKRLALLGRALAHSSRDGALLLLTATPHDGKTDSFLSLLRLLDPLVELQDADGNVAVDVASRLIVRRLKPEVTLVGGKRFIPPTIKVDSSLKHATEAERALNPPLDDYLKWLRTQELSYEEAGSRAKASGCHFLAGVLKKRFGSSVAALRATLRRRLELPPADEDSDTTVPYVDTDASDPEDEIIDPGIDVETPPPGLTEDEADLARALLDAAEQVAPGRDSKLQAMVSLLSGPLAGQKAVVFTEYRDTLRAAARRLGLEGIRYVTFHGGTPDRDRETAIRAFNHDPDVRVFLATDAASEGKNLQRACHHLIHLDVPWNPNRYAQRNGRIDRYGQQERPHIWVLVAADRSRKQGRPEDRALELVIGKLNRIQDELGSVSAVLPGFRTGRIRDVLIHGGADSEERIDELTDTARAEEAHADLTKLTLSNRLEIEEAERYVERIGTVDDFDGQLRHLLETTFYAWDDGGKLKDLSHGLVSVDVPRRLRHELGRETIARATFRRDVAVADQDDEEPDHAAEFLTPAHPLVAAILRTLRDEARRPDFAHRFDIAGADQPGLILSFVVRFVDGDGRTVDERLDAVEVQLGGPASHDPAADLERLGLDDTTTRIPNPADLSLWQDGFDDLTRAARVEATRRAELRRAELVALAEELYEEELGGLAVWKGEQAETIETMTLGTGARITFEQASAYEDHLAQLETEYQRRKDDIADRRDVRVASIELVGGRLYLRAAP